MNEQGKIVTMYQNVYTAKSLCHEECDPVNVTQIVWCPSWHCYNVSIQYKHLNVRSCGPTRYNVSVEHKQTQKVCLLLVATKYQPKIHVAFTKRTKFQSLYNHAKQNSPQHNSTIDSILTRQTLSCRELLRGSGCKQSVCRSTARIVLGMVEVDRAALPSPKGLEVPYGRSPASVGRRVESYLSSVRDNRVEALVRAWKATAKNAAMVSP